METVANKKSDFTDTMLTIILPTTKRMIEIQRQHVEQMEKERQDIIKKKGARGFWLRLLPLNMNNYIDHLDMLIVSARRTLNHLEHRLKEYEDYVLRNW